MDRQAAINDILRTALGSNENAKPPPPAPPQIIIQARQVIVVEGPVLLCDKGTEAAEALGRRRSSLFGQALRSAAANRRLLEQLGPPRL